MLFTVLLGIFQSSISYFWIGRLNGVSGLATLSVMIPVLTALGLIAGTVHVGVEVLTARATGSGGKTTIPIIINAGYLGAAWAVAVTLLGFWQLDRITTALAGDLDIAPNLRSYLIPWLVFYVFPVVSGVALFAVGGTGWTRFGVIQNIVSMGLLIVLMPVFVAVLHFGIAGVALSDGVSDALLLVLAGWALYRFRGDLGLGTWRRSDWRVDLKLWRELASVGLFYQLARASNVVAQLVLVRVVMEAGRSAVAGYGVLMQVIAMTTGALSCLGGAASIMIGQNVGAGNPERAVACLRIAVTWLFGIGVALLVLGSFAEPAFRIFTSDDTTIANALALVAIVKWAMPSAMTCQALLRAYTAVSPNKLGNMLSMICGVLCIVIASVWPGTPVERVGVAWVSSSYLRLALLLALYPRSFRAPIAARIAPQLAEATRA
ncbi:hypothetical protein BH11MYX1_BH11MYX1_39090 [soil metagenome]